MTRILAGSIAFQVSLFVFDKDGLLIQSKPFWRALAGARLRACAPHLSLDLQKRWLDVMGVVYTQQQGSLLALDADNPGILATASPEEEIAATATLLVEHKGLSWVQARNTAREIFRRGDETLDLLAALQPHAGFPGILRRLRKAGIPYGIATSDTTERTLATLRLYDTPEALSFIITPQQVARGKPAPDMLHLASRRCTVPLHEIAMVGDSLVDMQMAKEAGAIGIGIPETEETAKSMVGIASVILSSLEDIHIPPANALSL